MPRRHPDNFYKSSDELNSLVVETSLNRLRSGFDGWPTAHSPTRSLACSVICQPCQWLPLCRHRVLTGDPEILNVLDEVHDILIGMAHPILDLLNNVRRQPSTACRKLTSHAAYVLAKQLRVNMFCHEVRWVLGAEHLSQTLPALPERLLQPE